MTSMSSHGGVTARPRRLIPSPTVRSEPKPALDVEALRAATPGCATRIHLNNAGAGLLSAETLRTMVSHLEREANWCGKIHQVLRQGIGKETFLWR